MVNTIVNKSIKQLHGFFPSMLLLLSLPLILLSRLPYLFSEYIVYVQLLMAIIGHVYLYGKLRESSVYIKFQRYMVLFTILLLFNCVAIGNTSIKQLLYGTIINSSVALLILYVPLKKIFCHLLFFFALTIILIRWFVMGLDPEDITINSRNYIVFYLFIYALPYYYKCYLDEKQPTLLYPIVGVILAIIAIGRGSITMSIVLLIGWIYSLLRNSKHKIILFGFLTILVSFYIFSVSNESLYDLYFSRFVERGLDSAAREEGWTEYLGSLKNPLYFLCGSPVSKLPYVRSVLGGSLHNSYLTLHARMGVFCFFYFFIIIKSLLKLYKSKIFFLFFYFIAMAIKGYVDADFPCVSVGGDVNMYLLFLIAMSIPSSRKIKNRSSMKIV